MSEPSVKSAVDVSVTADRVLVWLAAQGGASRDLPRAERELNLTGDELVAALNELVAVGFIGKMDQ